MGNGSVGYFRPFLFTASHFQFFVYKLSTLLTLLFKFYSFFFLLHQDRISDARKITQIYKNGWLSLALCDGDMFSIPTEVDSPYMSKRVKWFLFALIHIITFVRLGIFPSVVFLLFPHRRI